jgi:hypothetical protein
LIPATQQVKKNPGLKSRLESRALGDRCLHWRMKVTLGTAGDVSVRPVAVQPFAFFAAAPRTAWYNPASRGVVSFEARLTGLVDLPERNRYPRMKFGEKYELLESLTTGGVETFVANDKIRGERVLVHILECGGQKPNQPTVQWVLEAFRRVAPEPAALVLETGRYSGTLYAYLVTKMPQEAALTNWVRLYKAQGHDTQEIPAPAAKPSAESEAPTANLTPKEPARAPGSITQLFREFDPNAKSASSNVPSQATEQPPRPLPNVKSAPDRSAVPPAPDWDARTPRISPVKVEPKINSSESTFSSAFAPRTFPSEKNSPTIKEGSKPGDFTSFFQGPFRVEGPSEIPAVSPQLNEPPRKTVGDFTAMFNPPRPEEPLPGAGAAGNESPGTGFTGWFPNPNVVSRTSGTAAAPPSAGLQRSVMDDFSAFPAPSKEPFVPPQRVPYVAPTPIVSVPTPIFPVPPLPNPGIEKQAATPPNASASDGATYAFNRPASAPVPAEPTLPSGPSAYTQIISVRPPAGPAGAPTQASPSSPTSPAASMPSVPAIAPPPMPAAPKTPKIAVPPAPKPPKDAVPGPPVSYWPLILTLTVLFFIAVLLVLYFALKH